MTDIASAAGTNENLILHRAKKASVNQFLDMESPFLD